MNMQETLKAIKALFQDQPLPAEPAPAPVEPVAPVEMKEYTLADGTAVMIDKLEIGGVVKVGELPAPEGEHKLADGSSITVDAAGIITEIEAAEPASPPAPVEQPAPVAMRDERVDALIAENKQIKQGFAQLVELVEALAAEPAAEPLEPAKDKFSAQREAKAEKFKQLQEVLKKHKQ